MTRKRIYSRIIVDRIEMFLDTNGWKYTFDSDAGVFRLGIRISEGMHAGQHQRVSCSQRNFHFYVCLISNPCRFSGR